MKWFAKYNYCSPFSTVSLHKTRDPHLCLHEAEGWTDGEQTEKSPWA